MTYIKDFTNWIKKKESLDQKEHDRNLFIYQREVWWCSMGVNVGVEIDGKNENFERPVLVIKKFNGLMFWGIPLTSKHKTNDYVIEVKHEKGTSYANIAQLRLFSTKRILRKVGVISKGSFQAVKEKIQKSLE
jgi:mRNA interferase MazF